jgi:hypothetical protein
MVFELEDRLESQKAVKESLRKKALESEQLFNEVLNKKSVAIKERDHAREEAERFKEDVSYLTNEAAMLLDEIKAEQNHSQDLEKMLRTTKNSLKD